MNEITLQELENAFDSGIITYDEYIKMVAYLLS